MFRQKKQKQRLKRQSQPSQRRRRSQQNLPLRDLILAISTVPLTIFFAVVVLLMMQQQPRASSLVSAFSSPVTIIRTRSSSTSQHQPSSLFRPKLKPMHHHVLQQAALPSSSYEDEETIMAGVAVAPSEYRQTTTRREMVFKGAGAMLLSVAGLSTASLPSPSYAAGIDDAAITDKVFFTVQGLPTTTADTTDTSGRRKVVIGLFGKAAPESTKKLKQLFSSSGLPAVCRPKVEKTLQKEQLEANKVYNSCKQRESTDNVNYLYSTIWRIIPNERIDVGAVQGKYLSKEFPNFTEKQEAPLSHTRPGIVSVRRGNDGGFGFTIYPGSSDGNTNSDNYLDEDNVVVGRVIEGMDVIEELNTKVPIIGSAKKKDKASTSSRSAPSRSCTYGGKELYCSENKPLIKLSVVETGVL